MNTRDDLIKEANVRAKKRKEDRAYRLDAKMVQDLDNRDEMLELLRSIREHKNASAIHIQESPRKAIAGLVRSARRRILTETRYILDPILKNQSTLNMKVSDFLDSHYRKFTKKTREIDFSLRKLSENQTSLQKDAKNSHNDLEINLRKDLNIIDDRLDKIEKLIRDQSKRVHESELDEFHEQEREPMVKEKEKRQAQSDEYFEYHIFERIHYNTESVRRKQRRYLDYLKGKKGTILDLGCGRGEFIKILAKEKLEVKGIDINPFQIKELEDDGLDASVSDIIEYLKGSRDKYSGITAFQVVEHLDHKNVKELIRLSYDRLEKNGIIILETINPSTPHAMSSYYKDPTHINPIPPDLLNFFLEIQGFKDIKILYSNPISKEYRQKDRLSNYHDYALIGYKDGKED